MLIQISYLGSCLLDINILMRISPPTFHEPVQQMETFLCLMCNYAPYFPVGLEPSYGSCRTEIFLWSTILIHYSCLLHKKANKIPFELQKRIRSRVNVPVCLTSLAGPLCTN